MNIPATVFLRAWAWCRRRRLARQDAVADQQRTLSGLLRKARDTRFGRDHGFASISDVAKFQEAVPLRSWEDFWKDYWEDPFPVLEDVSWPGRIPYFAVTSGTTAGRTKHIPLSREMLDSNRRAGLDVLAFHLARRPDSKVWNGRNFMLGGSTDLRRLADGVQVGDLSGIAAAEIPWFARPIYYPPMDLALTPDWSTKLDRLVEDLPGRDIRLISGTPSWLLMLVDRLCDATGKQTLGELFPRLEILLHGGVNFAPYRERFEALLEGSHAELAEVYPASEGFVAAQDAGPAEGLRLMADTGIFYEFVPVEELDDPSPTRHWLGNAELDREYALVLSTCAGIWGYVLGDTVRLVSRSPVRLIISGRTKWSLSVFGEHLITADVEQAIASAADRAGLNAVDWTMGAVMPERSGEPGYHHLLIEFASDAPDQRLQEFTEELDRALARENEDYEEHRLDGEGLAAPKVTALPRGRFAAWMEEQGRAGGQNKVPRLIGDPREFSEIAAGLAGE